MTVDASVAARQLYNMCIGSFIYVFVTFDCILCLSCCGYMPAFLQSVSFAFALTDCEHHNESIDMSASVVLSYLCCLKFVVSFLVPTESLGIHV